MVATPVIDRVKPTSPEIAPDFEISDRLDQKITLPSLNIEVPLSEIYRRIIGIS
jgi:hypothetical protein